MIKVLVVDDSPVSRELLCHVLSSDPDIRVIGTAGSGAEAAESMKKGKPDIITMDINMPGMDGFEATRAIMETDPVPIVIVTGRPDTQEMEMSFQAIEAGALAVLKKPHGVGHPDYATEAGNLVTTVRLMSEIKVVRRWRRGPVKSTTPRGVALEPGPGESSEIKVVAVGASTGGPPVIEGILSQLPKGFPAAVLIVQHMAEGFVEGLAEWLGKRSVLPVHVASDRSPIDPGHVYIAPDRTQMGVNANGRLSCTEDGPENGLRPSVSYLFRSVAKVFGKNAAGILLTGMGEDGAAELKLMREKGAVTIAQDKESCVVFGMPGEAIRINAARYVLAPDRIAAVLASLVMSKMKRR